MSPGSVALCLLLMQSGVYGFSIELDLDFSINLGFVDLFRSEAANQKHEHITQRAILNTTLQACRALALADGKDFSFPPQPFTVESVAAACRAPKSSKRFHQTIKFIQRRNRLVDAHHVSDPEYHFDNEKFAEGRRIISRGLEIVKASNKEMNFEASREKLGEITHTLQDFYSHSNWVELENTLPNTNLIKSGTSIGSIAAASSRATCRNCDGDNCTNNILEDIKREKILTSGYFGSSKPEGKCSHGGRFDDSKEIEPKGGINKDKMAAEHGHLHTEAADMAVAATIELLENIRGAAGDRTFLQMVGMSGKALCFVIDTTGSMRDDIATVRNVTSSIINSKVGTEDEPSVYILVPFNDPDFGPLMRTTDPNIFKNAINSLSATGGGDSPKMSLSGLQLALTGAPPNSEIFLFTDAAAKDSHLRGTVIALMERTKTVVNCMITSRGGFRRRRQIGNDQQQQQQSRFVTSYVQLYRDLAQASGGQTIEVTKSELPKAVSIITESSSSSLVTLLQAARSPGKAENFTFTVDESVKNLTVYITGRSVNFTLISPSGVSQQSTDTTGSLIAAFLIVGNFKNLELKTEVGLWEMKMVSTNPYTLKVVGESPIDFLFDFLEASEGPFGGFDVIDHRPRAGSNGTLLLTVTGSTSATVTDVILVESSGSGNVNGNVTAIGGGDYLVVFNEVPSEQFVVLMKGQNSNGSSGSSGTFQRQSTSSIKASNLTVTVANTDGVFAPGETFSVPFYVKTSGAGGTFTIRATNDRGFNSTFLSSLVLDTGGSANGTVNLTAPVTTTSGTDVTLTIEAESPGGADTNYLVLRLAVLKPVTDFTEPLCELLSRQSNCTESCSLSTWELSVQVTDGANGTGVDRVSLRQGNGTMNTSLAAGSENITLVSYTASCCSPDVELLVVDGVGNVGSCSDSVRQTSPSTTQTSTSTTQTSPSTIQTSPSTTQTSTSTIQTSTSTTQTSTSTTQTSPSTTQTSTSTIQTSPSTTQTSTSTTQTSTSTTQTSTSTTQISPSNTQAPPQTPTAAPVGSFSTKAVQSFLLCIVITIFGLNLPFEMGIN